MLKMATNKDWLISPDAGSKANLRQPGKESLSKGKKKAYIMRGLLSDRFLKWFASKREDPRKQTSMKTDEKEQNTDAEKIGGQISHEAGEVRENEAIEIEESNSSGETKPQAGKSSPETSKAKP